MRSILAVVGALALAALSRNVAAEVLPHHTVISDEISENRRSVGIRVDRRLDEADALRIAAAVQVRARQPVARTYVNYFLPGMPVGQGPWASVLYAPAASGEVAPKFFAYGLKREDEQALIAEHRADTRPLIGSWLTSPPAAPGRLTIYGDAGHIYAEWRLRNGQKTIDELRDVATHGGRRFEVTGGGHYVVTRSGDLELWSGSTLIALAERIRAEPSPAARMALGSRPAALRDTSAPEAPRPAAAGPRAGEAASSTDLQQKAPAQAGEAATPAAAPVLAQRRVRTRDRKEQSASAQPPGGARPSTTGDQISAKFAGAF